MKKALLLAVALSALAAPARTEPNPKLSWFKPLLGKTWRGTLPGGAVDVHRFELILNGQVVRTIHSVNDGAYAGEALVYWDAEKQSIVSHYVTTGGFYTSATIRFENGAMLSHILADGRLQVKTEQLKDGQWTPGGERLYVEDPGAVLRFQE